MVRLSKEKDSQGQLMFSVVSICFNNKAGILKTYNSLKEQKDNLYEWIVIDGNSSDGTREFLKEQNIENLILISEKDKGIYDAMNKSLKLAKGQYTIFMNAGDMFADNKVLINLCDHIENEDYPDFVYGDSYEESAEGRLMYKKARSHKFLWYGMFTHHQAMLYKNNKIKGLRYNLSYSIGADYGFTAQFLKSTQRVSYIPSPICIFENGGVSSLNREIGEKDQWNIRKDILKMNVVQRLLIKAIHDGIYSIKLKHSNVYKRMRFNGRK